MFIQVLGLWESHVVQTDFSQNMVSLMIPDQPIRVQHRFAEGLQPIVWYSTEKIRNFCRAIKLS